MRLYIYLIIKNYYETQNVLKDQKLCGYITRHYRILKFRKCLSFENVFLYVIPFFLRKLLHSLRSSQILACLIIILKRSLDDYQSYLNVFIKTEKAYS